MTTTQLTVPQAVMQTGIPKETLRSAMREGRLRHEKYGQGPHALYLIEHSDLIEFARAWKPRGKGNDRETTTGTSSSD